MAESCDLFSLVIFDLHNFGGLFAALLLALLGVKLEALYVHLPDSAWGEPHSIDCDLPLSSVMSVLIDPSSSATNTRGARGGGRAVSAAILGRCCLSTCHLRLQVDKKVDVAKNRIHIAFVGRPRKANRN